MPVMRETATAGLSHVPEVKHPGIPAREWPDLSCHECGEYVSKFQPILTPRMADRMQEYFLPNDDVRADLPV